MTPQHIIQSVSEVTGICIEDIIGANRKAEFTEARSIAIGLISETNPELSSQRIGVMFNNRHRATVKYAKECFENYTKTDRNYRHLVEQAKKISGMSEFFLPN